MPVTLINERTHDIVATSVELAIKRAARRKGLLGREALAPDMAMVLTPCRAVHTAFMRFAIDVVFLDRDGRVARIVHEMQPWRMAVWVHASSVIEMAAGRVQSCDIRVGDRLYLSAARSEADLCFRHAQAC
jgi:uncharacterized membrane protein (UPF0127 family)